MPLEHVEETIIERRIEMLEKMPASERAEEISEEIEAVESQVTGWEESLDALIDQLTFRPSPAIRERVDNLERDLAFARNRLTSLIMEQVNAHGPSLELKTKAFIEALEAEPLDRAAANVKLRELCQEVVIDWTLGVLRLRWHHGGETELQYGWPDEEWNARAKAAE